MESSLLGYVRLPSKKPISTQGVGLASSKAHSTSSKGKRDFLAAGNAAIAANVWGNDPLGEKDPQERTAPDGHFPNRQEARGSSLSTVVPTLE